MNTEDKNFLSRAIQLARENVATGGGPFGAVYWSRISRVVYASDRHDAEIAGFRDAELYLEIALDPESRGTPFEQMDVPEKGMEFIDWKTQI